MEEERRGTCGTGDVSIAQLEELLKRLKTGGSLGGTKEDADAAAAKFGLKDK